MRSFFMVLLIGVTTACTSAEYRDAARYCRGLAKSEVPPNLQTRTVTRYSTQTVPDGNIQCTTTPGGMYQNPQTDCTQGTTTISIPYTAQETVDLNRARRASVASACVQRECMDKGPAVCAKFWWNKENPRTKSPASMTETNILTSEEITNRQRCKSGWNDALKICLGETVKSNSANQENEKRKRCKSGWNETLQICLGDTADAKPAKVENEKRKQCKSGWNEALQLCLGEQNGSPTPEVTLEEAMAELRSNNTEQAIISLSQIAEGGDAKAYEYLALAHGIKKDWDKALKSLKNYLNFGTLSAYEIDKTKNSIKETKWKIEAINTPKTRAEVVREQTLKLCVVAFDFTTMLPGKTFSWETASFAKNHIQELTDRDMPLEKCLQLFRERSQQRKDRYPNE